eukprot:767339-Hanusia_phi.AAC.2
MHEAAMNQRYRSPRSTRPSRGSDKSPAATWSTSRSTKAPASGDRSSSARADSEGIEGDRYERMKHWIVSVQISGKRLQSPCFPAADWQAGASHQKRAGGRAHVYYGSSKNFLDPLTPSLPAIDVTVQFGDQSSDSISYNDLADLPAGFLYLHLQLLREFPQLRLPHIEGGGASCCLTSQGSSSCAGGWNIFRHQHSADFIGERIMHLQDYMR